MADTLILAPDWPTGALVYLRLRSGVNVLDTVASPKTFVPLVTANWARYAILVPETPTGSRERYLDFLAFAAANPAIVPADLAWRFFVCASGAPVTTNGASTDVEIGSGGDHWDGTAFSSGDPATIAAAVLTHDWSSIGSGGCNVRGRLPSSTSSAEPSWAWSRSASHSSGY